MKAKPYPLRRALGEVSGVGGGAPRRCILGLSPRPRFRSRKPGENWFLGQRENWKPRELAAWGRVYSFFFPHFCQFFLKWRSRYGLVADGHAIAWKGRPEVGRVPAGIMGKRVRLRLWSAPSEKGQGHRSSGSSSDSSGVIAPACCHLLLCGFLAAGRAWFGPLSGSTGTRTSSSFPL